MKYKSFRQVTDLLAGHETYKEAYAEFLQAGNVPPSLEDIFRLQQHHLQENTDADEVCVRHILLVSYSSTFNHVCFI